MAAINIASHLDQLGLKPSNLPVCTGRQWFEGINQELASHSPVDGALIASTGMANTANLDTVITAASQGFDRWRTWTAPQRGEVIRNIGNQLRDHKEALGTLVSYEMGKSLQEGLGEVQEIIDIADFAVGLSRQLYGLSMHSERPNHRMYEQWHPLGPVGIITAFNFPVAVWGWNAMIAAVCGNSSLWKPSEKTPLTAIACMNIIEPVLRNHNVPEGVFNMIIGSVKEVSEPMVQDPRLPLISATGSTRMGKAVGELVARRLGKSILELGGNNAIIVTKNADLKLAIPAITFGAIGTCGQRCTSTRRVIVHASLFQKVKDALIKAYKTVRIGNPLDETNHIGPLIDQSAVTQMQQALEKIKKEGGNILFGGDILTGNEYASGCYVTPCLVEAATDMKILKEETFAPILYLVAYDGPLSQAIEMQNDVPQGLSSAIFSENIKEVEYFLSSLGSDCGIANANIGTSGAEIGGAFGGEKETGGGRESGSDAWKGYMRRQTTTINYGNSLPLAQGITFELS